jgi:hypothetical protein
MEGRREKWKLARGEREVDQGEGRKGGKERTNIKFSFYFQVTFI